MANNFDAYFNTPSKQKRGEERVEKILDSLEQTLDANPMAELDVRSIANAANISTGALYHHFPSISNLLTSLFIRKVKSTTRKTIDLINQLGPSVKLDELANVLVDHTFLVWSKGNPNIKKISINFFLPKCQRARTPLHICRPPYSSLQSLYRAQYYEYHKRYC